MTSQVLLGNSETIKITSSETSFYLRVRVFSSMSTITKVSNQISKFIMTLFKKLVGLIMVSRALNKSSQSSFLEEWLLTNTLKMDTRCLSQFLAHHLSRVLLPPCRFLQVCHRTPTVSSICFPKTR